MAITANRYLLLFLLFVAAGVSYVLGFVGGLVFFAVVGVIFEGMFWFNLFFRRKRR